LIPVARIDIKEGMSSSANRQIFRHGQLAVLISGTEMTKNPFAKWVFNMAATLYYIRAGLILGMK